MWRNGANADRELARLYIMSSAAGLMALIAAAGVHASALLSMPVTIGTPPSPMEYQERITHIADSLNPERSVSGAASFYPFHAALCTSAEPAIMVSTEEVQSVARLAAEKGVHAAYGTAFQAVKTDHELTVLDIALMLVFGPGVLAYPLVRKQRALLHASSLNSYA
jgi:hypothetical protein